MKVAEVLRISRIAHTFPRPRRLAQQRSPGDISGFYPTSRKCRYGRSAGGWTMCSASQDLKSSSDSTMREEPSAMP